MVYTYRLSPTEKMEAEKAIIEELRRRAAEILDVTPDQIAVRTILPKTDLGFSDEVWTVSLETAGGYNAIANVTVPSNKVLFIYGIKIPAKDLDGDISVVKIYKGNDVIEVIDLQKSYDGEKYPEIILKKRIEYAPNDVLKIEVYLKSGVTTPVSKNIIVLGYVGEKLGVTITSPELQ